ncbi:tyrosine-protein phosphatase [Aeromicrobium stalagmiti]|uniref:tyrosine-protein phosphatase n=1 Tax=Aeromicrobium stalagmiti TaxID=2738988 RepID=UPI00156A2F32|nr:tyrosine-protein phosphatase [Aeromicrobium stalagmiti]
MTETTPNLRDVGGLPAADGRTVAPDRVLRSAVPSAKDVGLQGITWPPRLVIDLRSAGESEPVHPLARTGVRVVNLPLLSALRPGAQPVESLHGLYLLMLDQASMYFIELVREVSLAPGATLIHCAAGKDRTGVSVALLLRLVGVPRDAVVDDYLATADAEQAIVRRLAKSAGHRHRSTLPASFFGVSPEAIHAVLDVWDDHPEGVEGWFLEIGGTRDQLDQLRRTLLT